MDLFEYILILTSVIYALAVAQVLSGVSRIAQSRMKIRGFLPHKIWIFNLFLFIFLIWWATWEFRAVNWTFPQYAYLLIAPTLLFFVCSLLTPKHFDDEEKDIEAHFKRIQRPFFATYFFAVVAVIIDGNILSDEPIWHSGRYGHLVLLVASISGYFASSRNGQIAVALITLVALFATTAARFWFPR
ncbi:MAG: hypothetical protein OEY08_04660 [Gammaproteobacteria bacterium]|nr:hypothetical protein [Gammaproteobacteria bacterium]